MQRICGTKQLWEILSFSGRFDAEIVRDTQELPARDPDDEEERPVACGLPVEAQEAEKGRRRALLHAKAVAKARYFEGERLAALEQRGSLRAPSAAQLDVLSQWHSGQLREHRNNAIAATGHGRLLRATGEVLDIGGSTGGGSRRILDNWQPPDWRKFLEE